MDLSLRSIETNNWSADKFTARLYPAISRDTVLWHYKDVHYQVKKILYDLDTCRCH